MLANQGFLCRSAFDTTLNFIGNVQDVDYGHTLYLYYSDNGAYVSLGAFEITDPPKGKEFAGLVKGTALQIVTGRALEQTLQSLGSLTQAGSGYEPDPLIGRFTGWVLTPLNIVTPAFPQYLFPFGFPGSLREL